MKSTAIVAFLLVTVAVAIDGASIKEKIAARIQARLVQLQSGWTTLTLADPRVDLKKVTDKMMAAVQKDSPTLLKDLDKLTDELLAKEAENMKRLKASKVRLEEWAGGLSAEVGGHFEEQLKELKTNVIPSIDSTLKAAVHELKTETEVLKSSLTTGAPKEEAVDQAKKVHELVVETQKIVKAQIAKLFKWTATLTK